MPDRRPLHYTSAPKIREAMGRIGAEHADQLAVWIRDLEALGAERNEVLSTLAHLTALGADRALELMGERMAELDGAAYRIDDSGSLLAQLFLADVMLRARDLSAGRRPHG